MARTLACLRYFLIGGAIVVALCGIAGSACAGYFIYRLHEYAPLTPNDVCTPPAALLALGLATSVIGWCAWQFLDFTHRGQVTVFTLMLILIVILETSAGIWAVVRHEQIETLPTSHLEKVFARAVKDEKLLWDRMQSRLQCCGVNGPADYQGQHAVPWSCCDHSSLLNSSDSKGLCTTMYSRGCHHVVINRTRSILLHIFLLALCSVLLKISFVLCMSCYSRACKEKMQRRKELMMAAQNYAQATRDPDTKDQLLTRQARYSTAPTEIHS